MLVNCQLKDTEVLKESRNEEYTEVYCEDCNKRFIDKTGFCPDCNNSFLRQIETVDVFLEGGLVYDVSMSCPWVDVKIIDYDTEGSNDERITQDKEGRDCFMQTYFRSEQ
jgi:hypothetical protein